VYSIPEDLKYLYHSTTEKSAASIEKEGLKTDYQGLIYLSEKPIQNFPVVFKVEIPNKNSLVDWRDVWYDDDGEEIDMDHQYDLDNPYYVYMDPIPAQYLTRVRR
jgi:hypothetical protein